jgi:hypothetical protein
MFGKVNSRINLVPFGKDVDVGMNVPPADISLIARFKTCFPFFVIVSSLTGKGYDNLSYLRLSSID